MKFARLYTLKLALARLYVWLWRFRELPFANNFFGSASSPHFLKRSFYGFNLHIDVSRTDTHRLLYLLGERFIEERRLVLGLIKPGARIVDVGANIGYYLLMFQSVIRGGGYVYCFEPEPSNLIELKKNIGSNTLENVQLIESAVGMENGLVNFARGINGHVTDDDAASVEVKLVKLDSALSEKPDFIKIDVEGYEMHVLLGAEGIISKFRPKLFIEIHPSLLPSPYMPKHVFNFVKKYYEDVVFYQKQELNWLGKIKHKYLGKESITAAKDTDFLLNDYRKQFWLVCQ